MQKPNPTLCFLPRTVTHSSIIPPHNDNPEGWTTESWLKTMGNVYKVEVHWLTGGSGTNSVWTFFPLFVQFDAMKMCIYTPDTYYILHCSLWNSILLYYMIYFILFTLKRSFLFFVSLSKTHCNIYLAARWRCFTTNIILFSTPESSTDVFTWKIIVFHLDPFQLIKRKSLTL